MFFRADAEFAAASLAAAQIGNRRAAHERPNNLLEAHMWHLAGKGKSFAFPVLSLSG